MPSTLSHAAPRPGRAFAHSNDAVTRLADPSRLPPLPHLAGRNIVTVDMDGTAYDPWACCGHRGNFGTDRAKGCTHARRDTLDWVAQRCADHDALPVVLSWRAGLVETTRTWVAEAGFAPAAMFIPGAADDVSGLLLPRFRREVWGGGQVQFKVATVITLQVFYGCTVVGATDDNGEVVGALADRLGLGRDVVRHCPRLVTVEDHEWSAGYLGAPRVPEYRRPEPRYATKPPAAISWPRAGGARQESLWPFDLDASFGGHLADDPFDDPDDDLLSEWGVRVGDRVMVPDLGADGMTGTLVGADDGLLLVEDDDSRGRPHLVDPEDVFVRDPQGWTPLSLAAHDGGTGRAYGRDPGHADRAGDHLTTARRCRPR